VTEYVTKDEHMRMVAAIVKLNRAMAAMVQRLVTLEKDVAGLRDAQSLEARTLMVQIDDMGRRLTRLLELSTADATAGMPDPETLLLRADVKSPDLSLTDHIKSGTFPLRGMNPDK
jgi:multidrug efflux pump subunit AcrA (membrane-fusion protein)